MSLVSDVLTSRRNPLVKHFRSLHGSRYRRESGLLLLEGTHLLESALQEGYELEAVCYTQAWQQRYPELAARVAESLGHSGGRMVLVSENLLPVMATTRTPDGVLATAPRSLGRSPQLPCSLGIAVETLQDPGNLGTILRTAAATQADGLWLTEDSVAFDHPKVLRASAGQWFQVPMATTLSLEQTLQEAQTQGVQVVATLPQAEIYHWDVDWTKPSLILLGNEGAGLSQEVAAIADVGVRIPLAAGVESLNVAVSLAVILYEAQRQRSLQ